MLVSEGVLPAAAMETAAAFVKAASRPVPRLRESRASLCVHANDDPITRLYDRRVEDF